MEKILKKHIHQKNITNLTCLEPERSSKKRISMPFYPKVTNRLGKILNKHDIQIIPTSESCIKNIICNYKDKVPELHKSGIYQEHCKNCDEIYIGQTRRKLIDRHKQHISHLKNGHYNLSAWHMKENNHKIDEEKFTKLKSVKNDRLLDSYESYYIATIQKKLMNREDAPIAITSKLFWFDRYGKIS